MDSDSAHEQQKALPLAQSGHPLCLHVESSTPLIGARNGGEEVRQLKVRMLMVVLYLQLNLSKSFTKTQ